MRRVGLFLSRFALGLWVALVCAFAFLLLFNAPTAPDAPFRVWRSRFNPIAFTYPLKALTASRQTSSFSARQRFKTAL